MSIPTEPLDLGPSFIENYKRAVDEARREFSEPLQRRLAELHESIDRKTRELKKERDERSQIEAELRKIDPALAPSRFPGNGKPGPKPRQNRTKPPGTFSNEKMTALKTWLQSRKEEINEGGGIRATDLIEREDFTITGHSSNLNKALNTLHEQGIIVVDRWVRGRSSPGQPTGKYFKVV